MNNEKLNLIHKLYSELDRNKNTAALISSNKNRFYLTGLNSSAGFVLIVDDCSYCLVDFRYFQAAKNIVKNCEVICFDNLNKTLTELFNKHKIKSLMIENEEMSLARAQMLKKLCDKNEIELLDDKTLDNIIQGLRMIKSEQEIESIREAQKITQSSFEYALDKLKIGMTEKELALEIEFHMRAKGAEAMSFNPIVLFGENAALPHGIPSDRQLRKGDFVLMDTGCIVNGYCSDMTRTVAYGFADEKQKSVYNIVLDAQKQAELKIKSGVKCSEIDKTARDIIYNAGYEGYFGHSTGHSVGLDIHESPRFSSYDDTILAENIIMTVEPGIYLPGEFGVRIEDMVIVKEYGCEIITEVEHELIII